MGKASTSESVLIETTTFYRTQVMFGQEIEAKVSIEPKNLKQPSKGQKFFGNKEKAEGNDERMTAVHWNDAAITFLPRPVCCFVRAIPRKVVALL